MAVSILTGFSLTAAFPILGRFADHTYVTSSDGKVWGCWGRSAGGIPIPGASGPGDSAIADCLSQVNSQAGIYYGLTGVCHQMANRILDPANVLVTNANGYQASWMAYGHYGLDWPSGVPRPAGVEDWHQRRSKCYARASSTAQSQPLSVGNLPGTYLQQIRELYTLFGASPQSGSETAGQVWRYETELAIKHRLGPHFPDAKIREIVQVRLDLRREAVALGRSLLAGTINGRVLAQEMNRLLNEALQRTARQIGPEPYQELFDLEPNATIAVVDPDLMSTLYQKSPDWQI